MINILGFNEGNGTVTGTGKPQNSNGDNNTNQSTTTLNDTEIRDQQNGLDILLEALSQSKSFEESSMENIVSIGKRKYSDENLESKFSDNDSSSYETSNDSSLNGTGKKARNSSMVTRRQKKNKDRVLIVFENPTLSFDKCNNDNINSPTINCLKAFLPTQSHNKLKSISVYAVLKGIDALDNGRYRVQLNTFSKDKKKFSRNCSNLYETLWIYEISLLIADSPTHLSQQLKSGNYQILESLGCFGLCHTPIEYYFELLQHILKFYEEGSYFSSELIQTALNVSQPFVSSYLLCLSSKCFPFDRILIT
mmetsp:Transcript_27648/g.39247  ORF Transcript_27648/g.39247 Transcript_27648/m.39247 type:complete len:308 (+) Transcript_27648:40-963(+)